VCHYLVFFPLVVSASSLVVGAYGFVVGAGKLDLMCDIWCLLLTFFLLLFFAFAQSKCDKF